MHNSQELVRMLIQFGSLWFSVQVPSLKTRLNLIKCMHNFRSRDTEPPQL